MHVSSRLTVKDDSESQGLLIHDLVAAQAAQRPGSLAVICEDKSLTYQELDARSNQLAHYLQQMGVGPEILVALYLDRGLEMLVAILGVLKAGGAYVPIDREYPTERIRFLLADATPRLVLTEERLVGQLPVGATEFVAIETAAPQIGREAKTPPPCKATNQNAAYVIYTSGSTGVPKGVVVTHFNVIRLFKSTEHWFQFSAADVWTLFHSVAFDFSVWEMWGALFYGGKLVVVPYVTSRSPGAFYELLARERVTVLNQTPSAFRQLMWEEGAATRPRDLSLRWIVFGGEALDLKSLDPWFERHGDAPARLVNMYGITETTVHVTHRLIIWEDVRAGRGSVVGQSIPDLRIEILDEHGQPCAPGLAGEIYVGGAGVARGYLRRPELTRERFITGLAGASAETRWYRSGDLARLLPDGDLEYLGRVDQQVKIRGFRIELGEIESVLSAHPALRECAVVARADTGEGTRLVAYVACRGRRCSVEDLRLFLKQKLPPYMVPAAFVFLDQFPLTVNGKLDRAALPEPGRARPELSSAFVAPRSNGEKILAAIWEGVLEIDGIGVHDNFFALGGDSIRSIQVLARALEQGLRISLEQLFEQPTINALARSRADGSAEEPAGTREPFILLKPADRVRVPETLEDAYPMAKLQIGMLYHSNANPDSAIFHDVFSFHFELEFDTAKLNEAAQDLAGRHFILRTAFDPGGYSEPLQLIDKRVQVPLTVEDLRGLSPSDQEAVLAHWIETEKRRPFDWSRAPLMRLHVQRYSDAAFQLIVSFHHVIMDGWSLAAMLAELMRSYSGLLEGAQVEVPPPAHTYGDFVRMETEAIQSSAARTYWKEKLLDCEFAPLPRWPRSMRTGGQEQTRGPEILVSEQILQGVEKLARCMGVPLRSVLLAAHCRVMSLVTGHSDLLTGLVVNGRPQVTGGEKLLGLFLNTLPFRVAAGGGTCRDLVKRTFESERGLIPHRRFPLAEIQRLAGGQPLFETVFDFVHFHVYRDLPGYGQKRFHEGQYFEANNFALYVTFMLEADGKSLQFHFDYDPNELCEPQIRNLCDYYVNVLAEVAWSPDSQFEDHCPLAPEECEQLTVDWNRTEQATPDVCVHQIIEDQAARRPDAVAAVDADGSLSYAELNRKASQMAARLQKLGLGPDVRVGIKMCRSTEMLVSLLAVWKAGGAYVPLDPEYPPERIEFMIKDAQLGLLVTDDGVFPGPQKSQAPVDLKTTKPNPDSIAYVIYTSGSTGRPKGVEVSHRALVNLLTSMAREPGLGTSDSLLAITTLSFDIAALELFLPLIVGARVVIAGSETVHDPKALARAIESCAITVMQATPTAWSLLVQSNWAGRKTLKVLCGGEAMSRELANALMDRCDEIWNLYGPTETTVWSCAHKVERGDGPVPIGRPIGNTEVYLLDSKLNLVPTGSEGELCIGGAGLARGYSNQAALTAEKFVNVAVAPGGQKRIYRTGDRARYLPDGTIVCLGRADQQVKLRGFRIELGEIETVLAQHPAVTNAAVVARDDAASGRVLVAYYVAAQEVSASTEELRRFLATKLPSHMIPTDLVALAAFPLTPNGKINRAALPALEAQRRVSPREIVLPRTPLEEEVAALWKEILKADSIGVRDDFFELGGHSLLAIQFISRLRQRFQIDLSLASLFENPRLEDFTCELLDVLMKREESTLATIGSGLSEETEATQADLVPDFADSQPAQGP